MTEPGHPTSDEARNADARASILRSDEGSAFLRRRMERPARLGRYVLTLLGIITALAGFTFAVTTKSMAGYALGVFGSLLVVLGLAQHFLIRRDNSHWPEQVLLWQNGLELVLHNGEVRGLSWTDPDLALNLVSRKAPPPANREYLLVWMSDPKVPAIELSADGYQRLKEAAEAQRLLVSDRRRGRRESATVWTEIRQSGPPRGRAAISAGGVPSQEE